MPVNDIPMQNVFNRRASSASRPTVQAEVDAMPLAVELDACGYRGGAEHAKTQQGCRIAPRPQLLISSLLSDEEAQLFEELKLQGRCSLRFPDLARRIHEGFH